MLILMMFSLFGFLLFFVGLLMIPSKAQKQRIENLYNESMSPLWHILERESMGRTMFLIGLIVLAITAILYIVDSF